LSISQELDVASNLEMVFLLANESIIGIGEIESLVGIDPVVRHRPEKIPLGKKFKKVKKQLTVPLNFDRRGRAIGVVGRR
jgi:hypothetical protein